MFGGQSNFSGGLLAQDATTATVGDSGRSAACAGLAGDGATLGAVGEGRCLTPGDNASVSAGSIDLSGLELVRSDLLTGLDQELLAALDPVLGQLQPAAEDGLDQALASLGDLGLTLDLGAIQSRCTAGPDSADGDSTFSDVSLSVAVAGQDVDLLRLPVDPPPNTKVATDLGVVVTAVTDAVEAQFGTAFDGALGPVATLVDEIETALNDNVVSAIAEQLAPLEENLLDGTLNKQVRPTRDSIEVTALDVELLPAARDFGMEALTLEVGRSTCGPSGRIADTPPPAPKPRPAPDVPTSVPAGLDHVSGVAGGPAADGSVNDRWATITLALLAGVAATAGVAAYRRALR